MKRFKALLFTAINRKRAAGVITGAMTDVMGMHLYVSLGSPGIRAF
jgi:hypothetical protein